MTDDANQGISIGQMSFKKSDILDTPQYEETIQSHRDEGHTFHLLAKGSIEIEIDFTKFNITAPAVVYMHPNQVHRILDFSDITVCTLAIKNESLNVEYLKILEGIAPTQPLALSNMELQMLSDLYAMAARLSAHQSQRLHHAILRESSNTLAAYVTSLLLNHSLSKTQVSRFETITAHFKLLLDQNFCTLKKPTDYAKMLHISPNYLNECVKSATGLSASHFIQERIILEAKRMLCHSNKSVKEISFELGYVDYPYFVRLFSKATGTTALSFRNQHRSPHLQKP